MRVDPGSAPNDACFLLFNAERPEVNELAKRECRIMNVEVDAWANPACAFYIMTHATPASGPKGR